MALDDTDRFENAYIDGDIEPIAFDDARGTEISMRGGSVVDADRNFFVNKVRPSRDGE